MKPLFIGRCCFFKSYNNFQKKILDFDDESRNIYLFETGSCSYEVKLKNSENFFLE